MLTDLTVILFTGFNEVALPKGALIKHIEANGYEVSVVFKADPDSTIIYRQFYVAFNNKPTDYNQGTLHLLETIRFSDGRSSAMIYEVFP